MVQHQYFWEAPMPAEPKDLPRYAPSHELDMKKLRQEGKSKHGPPAGHAAPAAKRPRHADNLAPHHPHAGQQHDSRLACLDGNGELIWTNSGIWKLHFVVMLQGGPSPAGRLPGGAARWAYGPAAFHQRAALRRQVSRPAACRCRRLPAG